MFLPTLADPPPKEVSPSFPSLWQSPFLVWVKQHLSIFWTPCEGCVEMLILSWIKENDFYLARATVWHASAFPGLWVLLLLLLATGGVGFWFGGSYGWTWVQMQDEGRTLRTGCCLSGMLPWSPPSLLSCFLGCLVIALQTHDHCRLQHLPAVRNAVFNNAFFYSFKIAIAENFSDPSWCSATGWAGVLLLTAWHSVAKANLTRKNKDVSSLLATGREQLYIHWLEWGIWMCPPWHSYKAC